VQGVTPTAIGHVRTAAPGAPAGARAGAWSRAARVAAVCAPLLLVAGAAVLRLVHLAAVPADPYYDGAVRAMGLSVHNFLFGALEPGATVSLDKPPLDLWPAVISTKLLGYSAFTARLPEALAGVAAVALLYAALRGPFGMRAALGGAAALAVMPIEVITARSDTTDAIMMALSTLALYLTVRAVQRQRMRELLLAAAALGLAFDVKLAESGLALAPLALIAWLGLPRARLRALSAAAGVYAAVALAWLTMTLLVPASAQPYAVGSTDGSPWNAAIVFNGTERLKAGEQLEAGLGAAGGAYPQATQAERDRIPITPPAPTRLLARVGPLSGERLGFEVLAALLLGVPALLSLWRRRRRRRLRGGDRDVPRGAAVGAGPGEVANGAGPGYGAGGLAGGGPRAGAGAARIRRAVVAGLFLWLVEGIALFSAMGRLHPRYTEAFLPAVAALAGIGAAWVTARPTRVRLAILAASIAVLVLYAVHLLYGTIAIWWATLALGAIALGAGALAGRLRAEVRPGAALAPHVALAALLGCMLAIPLWASANAVGEAASDGNVLGSLPPAELSRLSAYLRAHQGSARYEAAYDGATRMGALVVHDVRPVLALTTVAGAGVHVLVSPARLYALARAGRVRYAVLSGDCRRGASGVGATDCAAPVLWVRAHATDVSASAGLPGGTLWLLPGAAGGR
jgi:4-amino-4-deoxy-L-arabinose transferase-like glycosyltransferase